MTLGEGKSWALGGGTGVHEEGKGREKEKPGHWGWKHWEGHYGAQGAGVNLSAVGRGAAGG